MSDQSPRPSDCERFEQLVLEPGAAPLSDADESFRTAHLASCEACRSELAILEELRFDGTAPAAEPMDELSRRRAILDIVAAAGQGTAQAAKPGRAGRAGRAGRVNRRWLVASGALAACLVAGLAVTLWPRPVRQPTRQVTTAPRTAAARVLLRSGDALLDRSPLRLDDRLRSGQRLESRSGRAALRLPLGSTLLVGADTELTLDRLATDRVELRLSRGELLASVTRRRDRQVFEVRTPSGRITVKGTAFSLYATGNYTALRVLRGVVVVQEPGAKPREVRPGRLVVLGKAVAASLASRLGAAGQRRTARVLWLLPTADTSHRHATLTLRTTPPGATVLVDSTPVGITPLAARLEPGQRRVTVRLADYDTVQESLALEPAAATVRHFELKPSRVAAGRPAPVEPPGPAATDPSSLSPRRPTTTASGPTAPTARDLLERAQRHRAARRWSSATRAYRELIRRYPATPEGRAALVSLGIMGLGPSHDTAGALRAFDRYLALTRRGDLAQEATYGRARALRRLGRTTAEIATLRDFLKRWPRALQAPQARKRLRDLIAKGVK